MIFYTIQLCRKQTYAASTFPEAWRMNVDRFLPIVIYFDPII